MTINTKTEKMVRVISDRIIVFPILIVEVVAIFFVHRLLQSGDAPSQLGTGILHMLIILLLLLIAILLPFLILYVYKFHVVNKALLEINPNFYEERKFDKWFDYYAKHMDQQEKTS